MAKFCGRCGTRLDEATGFCPKCDAVRIPAQKNSALQRNVQNPPPVSAPHSQRKPPKKKHRILKILLWLAVLLCAGALGSAAYFGWLELPFHGTETGEFSWEGTPDTDLGEIVYYPSSEEHVAQDADTGILYFDNEILVAINSEEDRPQLEAFIANKGTIVGEIPMVAQYQILLDASMGYQEIENLAAELEAMDWVAYASPNYALEQPDLSYVPNDEKWQDEWGAAPGGSNWGLEAIDAPGAWEYLDQMQTVNVGVFDDMFFAHEDLHFAEVPLANLEAMERIKTKEKENRIKSSSHGTHVAGTIAAGFDNAVGISGIVPKCNLYGVSMRGLESGKFKFNTTQDGENITTQEWIQNTTQKWNIAFAYLIGTKQCSVINISLSYETVTLHASQDDPASIFALNQAAEAFSAFLQIFIDRGYQFVICKAAGNQNLDAQYDLLGAIDNPKVANRIIMVGAVQPGETHKMDSFLGMGGKEICDSYVLTPYSQHGDRVDIVAPGGNQNKRKHKIYSTVKNGYGYECGTSMASPHAAGVAALVFSVNPDLTGEDVKRIIKESTVGSYGEEGYGLLNAKNAVEMALPKSTPEEPNTETLQGDLDFAAQFYQELVDTYGYADQHIETVDGTDDVAFSLEIPENNRLGIIFHAIDDFDQNGVRDLVVIALENGQVEDSNDKIGLALRRYLFEQDGSKSEQTYTLIIGSPEQKIHYFYLQGHYLVWIQEEDRNDLIREGEIGDHSNHLDVYNLASEEIFSKARISIHKDMGKKFDGIQYMPPGKNPYYNACYTVDDRGNYYVVFSDGIDLSRSEIDTTQMQSTEEEGCDYINQLTSTQLDGNIGLLSPVSWENRWQASFFPQENMPDEYARIELRALPNTGESDTDAKRTVVLDITSTEFPMENIDAISDSVAETVRFLGYDTARQIILDYYNQMREDDGIYVIFDDETVEMEDRYLITVRYQLSEQEATQRLQEGRIVEANTLVGIVTFEKETGQIYNSESGVIIESAEFAEQDRDQSEIIELSPVIDGSLYKIAEFIGVEPEWNRIIGCEVIDFNGLNVSTLDSVDNPFLSNNNPHFSIYGVVPEMKLDQAVQTLISAGCRVTEETPYEMYFTDGKVQMSLIHDGTGVVLRVVKSHGLI